MNRRAFLSLTAAGAASAAWHRAYGSEEAVALEPVAARAPFAGRIEPFAPGEVTLGPGALVDARTRNHRYLDSLPVDRLLHMFRVSAAITSSARPLGGWESPDCDLRGHFAGHYLSACALMSAHAGATGLAARAASAVGELARCQQAIGNGYLGAYQEEQYDRLRSGAKCWAPFYTLHKILAGHLDLHVHTGNTDALAVAEGLASWVGRYVKGLSEAHWQRILQVEHGGMNEVLYDLAAVTGKEQYLELGHRFAQPSFFDPLAERRDELKGLHVNTQIPKVIGAARRYELTGERRYRDIAEYFWSQVVGERSYCIGNTSNGELWHTRPGVLSTELGSDTAECCCAYNLMKLTRHLFAWTGEVRYADYYERALYNSRLGTTHPLDGRPIYYYPLGAGWWKLYGSALDSFWCCTGTGVEEFARTSDAIFFRDADGIFVNLFAHAEARWQARGIRIAQETTFPAEPRTRLTLTLDRPQDFALRLRIPYWATAGGSVSLNGSPLPAFSSPSSYLVLRRTWRTGDVVELTLPMSLHAAPMPDDPSVQAMMYGPLVLATRLGAEGLTEELQTGGYSAEYKGKPVSVDDIHADPAGTPWVEAVPGQTLAFRTVGQKSARDVSPLNAIHGERYAVYMKLRA